MTPVAFCSIEGKKRTKEWPSKPHGGHMGLSLAHLTRVTLSGGSCGVPGLLDTRRKYLTVPKTLVHAGVVGIIKQARDGTMSEMLKTGAARARPLDLVTDGAFKMHTSEIMLCVDSRALNRCIAQFSERDGETEEETEIKVCSITEGMVMQGEWVKAVGEDPILQQVYDALQK
ncbi:hypothetical protein NDU88_004497 [Pleurodeles waltl]|uniref:Uncharacterized protein n=1 Tax=Pleurodeles waltl TaxID=8319 RepID=A0AAV7QCI6_PLEWA|nr:hypothetical protein NDU88_004497 [Pleurodeles waltl]